MPPDPHLYAQILAHVQTAAKPTDTLAGALGDLYRQGWVGGQLTAQMAMGQGGEAGSLLNWEAAADKLLSDDPDGGLAGMLADAGVTIKSVAENRMGELASRLAYAISDGATPGDLTEAISGVLDDPQWAQTVAVTETARAMTAASLDEYAANGVGQKAFLTTDDDNVDEKCQENEDAGPVDLEDDFPNGDPPVHPNCRCTVIPVMSSQEPDQPADQPEADQSEE